MEEPKNKMESLKSNTPNKPERTPTTKLRININEDLHKLGKKYP